MPRVEDKSQIREVLETDRNWAAFALADLAPPYSDHAEWYIPGPPHRAVLLLYRGFAPPVLFTQGPPDSVRTGLSQVAHERTVYLNATRELLPTFQAANYDFSGPKPMLRLVLEPDRFRPHGAASAVRLNSTHLESLQRLYAEGESAGEAPGFFDASMMLGHHGVFYGIWGDGELVAAAGTLVLAPSVGVAAIGNVYMSRDKRGQGLGTAVTAAVMRELLAMNVRTIVLNVEAANAAAIRVYERLGFRTHCRFFEGTATRTAP